MKYERKSRRLRRGNTRLTGAGFRVLGSSADPFRYPRVRSARRYIILHDGVSCLTILYKCFAHTGYGSKEVANIHREEPSLLERYGDRLCWK